MSNVEPINKHMALVCPVESCGSVRFCLRQDKRIECHECGAETKYLWGLPEAHNPLPSGLSAAAGC